MRGYAWVTSVGVYCTRRRTTVVGSHCYAREVCIGASGGICAIYLQTTLEARGRPLKSLLSTIGGVGIRRFRPWGGHQNNPFRG